MEINNLLNEASQGYKVMQADSEKLASKWTASGLLEGLESHDKNNMAMILENQAKQIVAEANTTGTVHLSQLVKVSSGQVLLYRW